MTTITLASWTIDANPEATRAANDKVSESPEACGCSACRNFVLARSTLYPETVVATLRDCGIEPIREVEIYHNGRLSPGLHSYGGWFHVVGRVVDGNDARRQLAENAWTYDLAAVTDRFEWGVSKYLALVASPFEGQPLVQIEFSAEVPWLLGEDEPE